MSNFPKLFKKFFGWLEFYEKNKRKSVPFQIWADGGFGQTAGQTLKEVGVGAGAQTDPGLGQRHILACK